MLECAIQSLVEFLKVRQEPHLIATVRFVDEVPEGATLSDVSRDVAKDHEAPSIRHEFLNDLTSKTRLELEEILFKPFHRNKDQLGTSVHRLANQIQGILFASQFFPVWRADERRHVIYGCKRVRHISPKIRVVLKIEEMFAQVSSSAA
jgi:hypothetical protein